MSLEWPTALPELRSSVRRALTMFAGWASWGAPRSGRLRMTGAGHVPRVGAHDVRGTASRVGARALRTITLVSRASRSRDPVVRAAVDVDRHDQRPAPPALTIAFVFSPAKGW